jgi:hypothetical protein
LDNIPILGPIINALFGGFMGGIDPGQNATSSQVGSASGGVSSSVATIAAEVAALKASLADPSLLVVAVDFEGTQADELAKFQVTHLGTTPTTVSVANGKIKTVPSGGAADAYRFIYTGADHTSPWDDMEVELVLGDEMIPFAGYGYAASYVDLIGRSHATDDTSVRCRLYADHYVVGAINSGVPTVLGSLAVSAVPTGIVRFKCGTSSGHRVFSVTVGGITTEFSDVANVSQMGATYRERGFELGNGTANNLIFFVYETNTANIAHFTSSSLVP